MKIKQTNNHCEKKKRKKGRKERKNKNAKLNSGRFMLLKITTLGKEQSEKQAKE